MYTFKLDNNICNPLYSESLGIKYNRVQDQAFYTKELDGELSFMGADYAYIMSKPFDTEFTVDIYKDNELYFTCYFSRVDCSEDRDNHIIRAKAVPRDNTDDILNGYDTEHNILKLAPVLNKIQYDKRPVLQIYSPGDAELSCFLAGNSWEQSVADITSKHDTLTQDYKFSLADIIVDAEITGIPSAHTGVKGTYKGKLPILSPDGNYRLEYEASYLVLKQVNNNTVVFKSMTTVRDMLVLRNLRLDDPMNYLNSVNISGEYVRVYARFLTDREFAAGLTASAIGSNDITATNPNYRYAIGYPSSVSALSFNKSDDPTPHGMDDDGKYFTQPCSIYGQAFYPISKANWTTFSIWFSFSPVSWLIEEQWRARHTLRDAYALYSVIDVLLKEINPEYKFTMANSLFLYGSNPIKTDNQRLFLTQKTNILKSNYTAAARKAEVSLKSILEMLRDVYDCRWHMQGNDLIIEHVSFYDNGKAYSSYPEVQLDISQIAHVRHGKPYTFDKAKFTYDKLDTYEKATFAWSDPTMDAFEVGPVEVKSSLVEKGKTKETSVSGFNPDLDFMLLNPSGVSSDGFAILSCSLLTPTNIALGVTTYLSKKLKSDGTLIDELFNIATDYMTVTAGSEYSVEGKFAIAWYNSSKTLLSYSEEAERLMIAPVGAAYARISGSMFDQNFISFYDGPYASGYVVPYTSIKVEGEEQQIQNGFLSWSKLIPNYHVYNMPATTVMFDGEYLHVMSTMKIRKQSIWLSHSEDLLPDRLVSNGESNAVINTMTVNLTNRRIDLELIYDTH